jgi:PAS domain S-box-containing protein
MSNLTKPSLGRGLMIVLIAVVSLLCIASIAILASDVRRAIKDQATATADNTQWTLSQLDVEYFQMKEAVAAAQTSNGSLTNVRKRFDILFSRTTTLIEGQIFQNLQQDPDYSKGLANLRRFENAWVVPIDGDDTTLKKMLPWLQVEMEAMRSYVKMVPLAGIRVFALQAEKERQNISNTLIAMAALTTVMIVFLLALVAILLRYDTVNRTRAIQLSQTLTRTAAIVNTAFDAVVVVDSQGRCIEFNPAAERIFEFSRNQAIGAVLDELIIPRGQRDAHRITLRHAHDSGRGRTRLSALRRNGELFPVEMSIAHSMATDHSNYVYFMRDLSFEVATERELLQARDEALAGEKAKADLLAVMSHEMRTPLNGMLGMVELLHDTSLTVRQKKLLGVMRASGDLLLRHVNDVLSIARLESGKMPVQLTPIDIGALVQDIFDNQAGASAANGNVLHLAPSFANLPPLLSDNFQLRQILLNLVGNAVKFTENGQIRVEADYSTFEKVLEIRVIDNGIGMAAQDLDRIFEDFVTLDTSYARAADGTGLGLGITRRIVENLGGNIAAESELGKGSLLRVRLPMQISPTPTVALPQAPDEPIFVIQPQSPKHILVVEDNAINRLVVREMLEKQGHHVHEAHDGEDGVQKANDTRYDLIFMDISMPKMDGVAATTVIRNGKGMSANSPIIALTAHAMGAEITRFRAAGMQDVLVKPVTGNALALMLETFLPATNEVSEGMLSIETIEELLETMGEERARNLMQRFIKQTDEAVAQITCYENTDITAENLRAEIHKICGSAAMFGAKTLNFQLRQLEELCRAGNVKPVFAQWSQVQTIWQETCHAMQPHLQTETQKT